MGRFAHTDYVVGVAVTEDEFFETFREQLIGDDPWLYEPGNEDRGDFLECADRLLEELWPGQHIRKFQPWNSGHSHIFIGVLYARLGSDSDPDAIDIDNVARIRDTVKDALAVFSKPIRLQAVYNYI
jgi:hypothetical protein